METKKKKYKPNNEKLRQLILHISRMSEADETYGAAKLNKILFFGDFSAYLNFGAPITGQEYQALEQGPAPRQLLPVRDAMKTSGEIAIRESDFHGYKQNKVFALKEADLDSFTPREIALVDHLIRDFWGMTAQQISSVSHGFTGWRLAEQGETIPYEVALIARREPTPLERKRGIELEAMAMKARELSLDNAS